MTIVREWVRNDTAPITFTLKDADATAINLTGCTLKFFMRLRTATTNKVNGTAVTVTSAAAGECEYRWIAADVDTAGTYDCEIEITDAATKKLTTERMVLVIGEDLG